LETVIQSRLTELRTLATDKALTRATAQMAIVELCDALQVSQRRREKAIGPTLSEVMKYAQEIGMNGGSPEDFFDHYTAVGWVYGKSRHPIRDFRAAMRRWHRGNKKTEQPSQRNTYGVE
jgi:hypothetical protein